MTTIGNRGETNVEPPSESEQSQGIATSKAPGTPVEKVVV